MPNTGWRLVLEGDSIFGIFKLSFPFPFTLVRHRMELTINHFIQNISNSIERTHWILTSVSPMTTTFLEIQKIKINQFNIPKKISKYFKSSNFDDRIFLTVVRLILIEFSQSPIFIFRRFIITTNQIQPFTGTSQSHHQIKTRKIIRHIGITCWNIVIENDPLDKLKRVFRIFFSHQINPKTLSKSLNF